jgi:hypothetical protein
VREKQPVEKEKEMSRGSCTLEEMGIDAGGSNVEKTT